MPEISLPPAPVAPSSAAAAPSTAATKAGGEADDAQGSPFAALLQQQMAHQIRTTGAVVKPVDLTAQNPGLPASEAAADPAVPTEFMAALFGLQFDAGASAKPAATKDISPDDATALTAAANPTSNALEGTPIAAPLIATAVMQTQDSPQADSAQEPAAGLATTAPGQNASAILAATTKLSAEASHAGEEKIAASTGEPLPTRAEGMSQQTQQLTHAAEHATRIEAPVGSRHWDGEFANRLAWMVGRQEQRAELILTPPQLGRIEVSLTVNGDQANAIFTSSNPAVRDAIENALPRLREVLTNAGIELGQTHVGSESPQQSPDRGENRDNQNRSLAAQEAQSLTPASITVGSSSTWLQGGRGMVDVFA